MASLFPRFRNSNSSYLRFDIYEDLPLFYVDFVEFQKGIDNAGKLWVVYSYSMNVNRWSFVRDSSSWSTLWTQMMIVFATYLPLNSLSYIRRSSFLLALDILSPRNSMKSRPDSRLSLSDMFRHYRILLSTSDWLNKELDRTELQSSTLTV